MFFLIFLSSLLHAGISPFGFFEFDGDNYRYVINNSEYDYESFSPDKKVPLRVVKNDGYIVVRNKSIESAIGPEINFWFDSFSRSTYMFSAAIGLMPVKGSLIRSQVHIDTIEEVPRPHISKIPYDADDVIDWWPEDKVTYLSYGGLVTYANLNYYFLLNLDSIFYAKGSWIVEVKRKPDNKVSLQITKSRLKLLKLGVNFANALEVAIERFDDTEKTLKFVYDLDDETAKKAYEDALRGHLLTSQKMALDNLDERVSFDYKDTSKSSTTQRTATINFPLFPRIYKKEWIKGKTITDSNTSYPESKEKVKTKFLKYYKGSFKNRISRSFDKNVLNIKSFTGVVYKTFKKNDLLDKGKMAHFNWFYRNTKTKKSEFREVVREMKSYLGLKTPLNFELPAFKTFGYVGLYLDMAIYEDALEVIAQNLLVDKGALENKSREIAIKYFQRKDAQELCKDQVLKVCKLSMFRTIKNVSNSLGRSIINSRNQSGDKFLRSIRKISKKLVSNKFVMQAVMALAPRNIIIRVKAEGKLFAPLTKYYNALSEEIPPDRVFYDKDTFFLRK